MKNILLLLFIIAAGGIVAYKMESLHKQEKEEGEGVEKIVTNSNNLQGEGETLTLQNVVVEEENILTVVRTKYYNLIKYFLYDINVAKNCLFILVAALSMILIFRALHLWAALRIFSEVLFNLSYFVIALISIISLDMKYIFSVNIWHDTRYILLWFPLELLCISALGLYVLDFNFPIWRVIYNSLLFPICSFILIIVRDFIPI